MTRALLAVLLLAACPARHEPGATVDASVAADAIQLRAPDGRVTLRLSPQSGGGFLVEGQTAGQIERREGGLALVDGGIDVAVLRPGPAGPVLVDTGGTVLARVHAPDATTFDLLQPDGVAILRTQVVGEAVVARDRAGSAIATGRLDGPLWELDAPGGQRLASVSGTRDGLAALVLALPDLPAPMRALAAAHALGD